MSSPICIMLFSLDHNLELGHCLILYLWSGKWKDHMPVDLFSMGGVQFWSDRLCNQATTFDCDSSVPNSYFTCSLNSPSLRFWTVTECSSIILPKNCSYSWSPHSPLFFLAEIVYFGALLYFTVGCSWWYLESMSSSWWTHSIPWL